MTIPKITHCREGIICREQKENVAHLIGGEGGGSSLRKGWANPNAANRKDTNACRR